MTATLSLWIVYERPTDYPDSYVARLWEIGQGTAEATGQIILSPDLDWVRRGVIEWFSLRGCAPVRLERDPVDEPQIIEVWL